MRTFLKSIPRRLDDLIKKAWKYRLVILLGVVGIIVFLAIGVVIYWAVRPDIAPKWTGFGEYTYATKENEEKVLKKTLWDWMELLFIPLILALGLFFLNYSQRKSEQDIARDRQRQNTLEKYFDRMKELLLDRGLGDSNGNETVKRLARTLSINVLSELGAERNRLVIQFLQETELLKGKGEGTPAVHFQEADLRGFDLRGADLSRAHLSKADLRGADLKWANLRETHLDNADLRRADLSGAHLSKADLSGADLRGANLRETHLDDADLGWADLHDANLHGANLSGADLKWADLRRVDLHEAHLSTERAAFHLDRADLDEDDLLAFIDITKQIEARMDEATPVKAKLRLAMYSKDTTWPDGFDPQEAGALLYEYKGQLIEINE